VTATVLLAEDERDIADLVRYHVEQTGPRSREIGGPGLGPAVVTDLVQAHVGDLQSGARSAAARR
jgi:signal transduction histidine kinase